MIGRLADRYGKKRVFTILALISIGPILVMTHLPPLPLAPVVAAVGAVLRVRARPLRPGDGARHRQRRAAAARQLHELQRVDPTARRRERRRSRRASSSAARADGALTHFGAVGWLSVGCTLVCLWLARRIRIVDRHGSRAPDEAM